MSLSAVLDKGALFKPALAAAAVTVTAAAADSLSVLTSSGLAKADPAIARGLALGQDWYPTGTGGFQPTVPGAARPAQYGGGVWPPHVAGQSDIYTLAAQALCIPLLTRAEGAGANPTGALAAPTGNRTDVSVRIQSLDATGAIVAGDVGDFDMVLLNPAW